MKKNAIAAAAARFNGEIGMGLNHSEAMRNLREKMKRKNSPLLKKTRLEQGFIDIHGIFHTREAARKIAIAAEQVNKDMKFPNIALDSSEFTVQNKKGETVRNYKPLEIK